MNFSILYTRCKNHAYDLPLDHLILLIKNSLNYYTVNDTNYCIVNDTPHDSCSDSISLVTVIAGRVIFIDVIPQAIFVIDDDLLRLPCHLLHGSPRI